MKIPFNLHRRIPAVRRTLEARDLALAQLGDCTDREARKDERIRQLEQELSRRPPERKPEDPVIVSVPDNAQGELARRLLFLLRPMEIPGATFVRTGRDYDGGYVMLNQGLENRIAYSLGINDDVSWDLDMVKRGCQIYQYDHTIDGLPVEHPNFHWHKTGIAARPSDDGTLQPLRDLIRLNGHANETSMILKMDIEGYEWDVFEALPSDVLNQFSQIVVELHFFVVWGDGHRIRVEHILRKINETHQCVHVHANNWGYLGYIGGTAIPDVFEVTYVRRTDHRFETCYRSFPTELDMPCKSFSPDYHLGQMGLLPEIREEVEATS